MVNYETIKAQLKSIRDTYTCENCKYLLLCHEYGRQCEKCREEACFTPDDVFVEACDGCAYAHHNLPDDANCILAEKMEEKLHNKHLKLIQAEIDKRLNAEP